MDNGKTVNFGKTNCYILDDDKLVAVGTKVGDLYYLNCYTSGVHSNVAETQIQRSKEDNWHRRFNLDTWENETCRN